MSADPEIFGIVNITEDSFSDGGRYLDPDAAVAHARRLAAAGAAVIDLGAAASNIAAKPVTAAEEIRRLEPVVAALAADGIALSVDSFRPEVQRMAIAAGAAYLNDIRGFPDAAIRPELARAHCRLVVMHMVQEGGRAAPLALSAQAVWERIHTFFTTRVAALEEAGIARDRLVLDPGMGLFLSSRPEASLAILAGLDRLKGTFGLPVMVSVSRKSFLRVIVGRETGELGAATLAAELHAAEAGADFIRTHDPAALADALKVRRALRDAARHTE